MNKIRKEIIEQFPDDKSLKKKLLPGKDKQLVGYAEMFGDDCIPLYKGINYITCNSAEEAISKINFVNPKARTADGFDKCLLGHIKLDDGQIILLYDKDAMITQLTKEFSEDTTGLFDGEDDCYTSAIEHYEYNIIGSYMDGIPAFAILYSR